MTRPLAHLAFLLIAIGVSIYAGFVAGAPAGSTDSADTLQSLQAAPAAPPQGPKASTLQGVASADSPVTFNPAAVKSDLLGDFEGNLQSLSIAVSPPEGGVTSSLAATTGDASERICEPTTSSLYCIYTVQPGDSLSAVAEEFGLRGTESLPAAEILAQSNKPAVVQSDSIVPGLKLRIPVTNGIIHTVLTSETLPDVAERYGVSVSAIENLTINNITNPDLLLIGQELLVPDPIGVFRRQSEPPPGGLEAAAQQTSDDPQPESAEESVEPNETPTVAPTPTVEAEQTLTPVPGESTPTPETATPTPTSTDAEPTATATPTPEQPAETATPSQPEDQPSLGSCSEYATVAPGPNLANPSATGFIWPAAGPISSCFGPSHPLGIDIDFFAEPNQAVVAAASGRVTFAGGNPNWSYGYYVVIDHGNGFTTLYAHLSLIGVSVGQVIEQGQILGLGGRTGYATGNHLHFEILFNGEPINPVPFLP